MTILFCAAADGVGAVVMNALLSGDPALVAARDASETLRLMGTVHATVVVVGGASSQAVAASCRQLRAAEVAQDFVIVAASERPEDASLLIDAGADDFFVDSPCEDMLRSRLLVAERTATAISSRRAGEQDRAQVLQTSLKLICILGFSGYFQVVTPMLSKALGWSTAELLSKPWLDFVHPDDRESMKEVAHEFESGTAASSVMHFASRCQCKNGTYRWLEWQCVPWAERRVVYAVVLDITEARATKEALRELSESLSTTLNSIGDGVIATDMAGEIVRMNPIAEELTGWTLAQAKGKLAVEVLPMLNGDTRAAVESPPDHALREGHVVSLARNTLLVRRDGTELPIADSCAPIRSNEGTVNGAVLVFRDLTAQRHVEAIRERSQKQLILADRMAAVGTLAAGAAHEINNPLTYVAANVDTAIEEVRGMKGLASATQMKELEEMLVEAHEGITRVTKIVRGLKTFSRVEKERRGIIDLVSVIELSINIASNEIRHRAALVRDFGELPLINADDGRLGQVFINLLVNAAQAFPEGDMRANRIHVVTSTDSAGRAVVEIQDNGAGIPPAILGRVFDPFFTTKSIGVGTGLGLAISRNILTGMGGEISVESEVGRGTTFRVVLPPASAVEPSGPVKVPSKPSSVRPAAVLVVDDEPALGLAIRRVLRRHDVTVVTTAQDALDLLAAGKQFDVVLSDLMMPGMSGMELYQALVRLHPTVASKVVFLTGGAFTPEANAFLDRVENERMEKPFDPIKMREMVQKFALPDEYVAEPACA
jgi:PAS domain S-box-containing protein